MNKIFKGFTNLEWVSWVLLVVLFASILIAIVVENPKTENNKMILVETGYNYYVYYDEETMVMYIGNTRGGFSVMVNPDGTPKLYK